MEWRCDLNMLGEPRNRRDMVYVLLSAIPPGVCVTYNVLAQLVGTSPRAIGVYMRANKCLIVIPCHRVVASKGLGGFSRGVEVKKKLLKLEMCDKVVRSTEEYWRLLAENGVPVDVDLWG